MDCTDSSFNFIIIQPAKCIIATTFFKDLTKDFVISCRKIWQVISWEAWTVKIFKERIKDVYAKKV